MKFNENYRIYRLWKKDNQGFFISYGSFEVLKGLIIIIAIRISEYILKINFIILVTDKIKIATMLLFSHLELTVGVFKIGKKICILMVNRGFFEE